MTGAVHEIVGRLDHAMFIVTTKNDRERSGCLVGFITQCSIEPLRFIVFVSKKNHTYRVLTGSSCIAVHVVPGDEVELARLFGQETGDRIDKFSRCSWTEVDGAPVLDACSDWFVARIIDRVDPGDHQGLIVEPTRASAGPSRPFLNFQRARLMDPGHEA